MRRRIGLLGLGMLLIAGCSGLREQRNMKTESLRLPPGATKNYPQAFPEGPTPGNSTMVPMPMAGH